MLALAAVSFWIIRAQGLVYGYFNFIQIARYPDVIFPRLFRFIFGWIIPVIIVANIPARLLIKPLSDPLWLMFHLARPAASPWSSHGLSGISPSGVIRAQVPEKQPESAPDWSRFFPGNSLLASPRICS